MKVQWKFLFFLAISLIYILIYLYLPEKYTVKEDSSLRMSYPTQQLNSVKRNSTMNTVKEKERHRPILYSLYNHINQTAANITRGKLIRAGFRPVNSLRVYPEESIVNPNHTETTQVNGEAWIKPAQTCAVLGNSGILSGSKCGREIDAHDHVFRSNMPGLEGFEEDVGMRTSLVTINSKSGRVYDWCLRNKNDSCNKRVHRYVNNLDNSTIVWVTKASSRYPKWATVRSLRTIKSNVVVARPRRLLMRNVARSFKVTKPSSGLYLYSVAGTLCSKISLYGYYPFNQTEEGKPINYHYYENMTFVNSHDMPKEFKVLLDLNASRVMRLVTSPCS